MALQTTGAITLAQIQTEFGGVNPISLSEYYAGGLYVPTGTSGTNGAVPASGAISMSQFYGTSNIVLGFNSVSVFNGFDDTVGIQAQVTIVFYRNGTIASSGFPANPTSYFSPNVDGKSSLFEMRTIISNKYNNNENANPTTRGRLDVYKYSNNVFSNLGQFSNGVLAPVTTPWFDLAFSTSGTVAQNRIEQVFLLSAGGTGEIVISGAFEIRNKTTLQTISRGFSMQMAASSD